MKEEDIKRMWQIDAKAQIGLEITKDEKEFFNKNYIPMIDEMKSDADHWTYHTSKL